MKKNMFFTAMAVVFSMSAAAPLAGQQKPVNEKLEVQRIEKNKKKTKAEPKKVEEDSYVRFVFSGSAGTFLIGEKSQTVSSERKLRSFKISRFETTYSLWYKVRTWAENNGYVFSHPGQEGSQGGRGKTPTKTGCNEPVTNINWYDAVVWCNAYSEFSGKNPCYSYKGDVIRDATDTAICDLSKCDWNQNGYRLPSEAEWEFAARKTAKKLQSDLLASGQVDFNGDDDESVDVKSVGWISENAKGTHTVGTAGTETDPRKAIPGSGNPNGAGLYDMCGNVLEFCWDWEAAYDVPSSTEYQAGPEYGSERVMRGGSWNEYTMFYASGDRYSFDPNEAYNYFGFRIAASE